MKKTNIHSHKIVSVEQIRAARALLGWTQKDLAAHAGLNDDQVHSFEAGRTHSLEVLEGMLGAIAFHGIEFTNDGGLRPRKNEVITFQGKEGFAAFRADILAEGKKAALDVCVSNVDERQYDKWGGDGINEEYFAAMKKNKPKQFRILVKENDFHFSAHDYASYRWLPSDAFGEISFFIYADKTAIISFEDNQFQAFIIKHPSITAFYRKDFEIMWAKASDVKGAPA